VSDGDEVGWMLMPKAGDMLLLISDRGYGKRMLADDVDRQKRAGKGQRLLPMNRTGENGTCLAGLLDVTHAQQISFTQKGGHVTAMNAFEIGIERRAGNGQLLVSVLLDDVVTDAAAAD
ncbi:MAG: DNA gyrase C-terminal beta-propeller domain-containing protein, partial [Candidatus Ventricola sp.]|nr:DNA gyrase C-terminal beta-propeller domain-containing protein [Candidatus Ventricola sp.]